MSTRYYENVMNNGREFKKMHLLRIKCKGKVDAKVWPIFSARWHCKNGTKFCINPILA